MSTCRSTTPAGPGRRWECTLEAGHKSPHKAKVDGLTVCTWRRRDVPARLTPNQRAALEVLEEQPDRGYDVDELARRLGTSRHGAAATGSSLVRRKLATRFLGGSGGPATVRVHYQAADR